MKKLQLSVLLMVVWAYAPAQDTWAPKANFAGGDRGGMFCFSIGNKGYAGTGVDNANNAKSDFWEYDPSLNAWTQKADFGGGVRMYATGFSIGGKGYAGTGIVGSYNWRKDMWEYDTLSNTWKQIADFGGGLRYSVVGFSIGNKGYMGTGNYRVSPYYPATYYNDFWQYDPSTDTWTRKADVPTQGRTNAVGISIGDKGYIGLGFYYYDTRQKDWWEYNPANDAWVHKADLPGTQRYGASAFSLGNKGFVATGYYYSALPDFWEYDPSIDQWTQRNYTPLVGKYNPVAFALGNKGYLGMSFDPSGNATSDLWEYTPVCNLVTNKLETQIPEVYAVNPGGKKNTIYIGYGPTSVLLTAVTKGGNLNLGDTYTYSWSNGIYGNSTFVNPTGPGQFTYTVTATDSYGCTASAKDTIYVVDIRCGNNNDKVALCMVPPGKPDNRKQLCISNAAVASHLQKGSYLGSCDNNLPGISNSEQDKSVLNIYPNPNTGAFMLRLSNSKGANEVRITDQNSNIIYYRKLNISKDEMEIQINLGTSFKGIYTVQVTNNKGMTTATKTIVY